VPVTQNNPKPIAPQAGFTLVEVLVVLVLLGVIISLAISRLSAPLTEATIKKSTFQIAQDMQTISDAGQYYITDKNAVLTADASGTWKTEIRTGMLTSIPNPQTMPKHRASQGHTHMISTRRPITGMARRQQRTQSFIWMAWRTKSARK